MSNGKLQAFPNDPRGPRGCAGLTKRELFAALAMQGLSASEAYAEQPANWIASVAVERADALLAELEKTA